VRPTQCGDGPVAIAFRNLSGAPIVNFGFDKPVRRLADFHRLRKPSGRDQAVNVLARKRNTLSRQLGEPKEFDAHVDDTLRNQVSPQDDIWAALKICRWKLFSRG
jgi:hypothetical protein